MGIMGCYPDKRAIENELGGNWEEVEELIIDGGEIIEYDVDIDNITPLNINGIMVVFELTSTANTQLSLIDKDGATYARSITLATPANKYALLRIVGKNGFNKMDLYRSMSVPSNVVSPVSNIEIETHKFDNHYFKLALTPYSSTTPLTGTATVYFLRGV